MGYLLYRIKHLDKFASRLMNTFNNNIKCLNRDQLYVSDHESSRTAHQICHLFLFPMLILI